MLTRCVQIKPRGTRTGQAKWRRSEHRRPVQQAGSQSCRHHWFVSREKKTIVSAPSAPLVCFGRSIDRVLCRLLNIDVRCRALIWEYGYVHRLRNKSTRHELGRAADLLWRESGFYEHGDRCPCSDPTIRSFLPGDPCKSKFSLAITFGTYCIKPSRVYGVQDELYFETSKHHSTHYG